jgi:phage FluMu protein Com
MLVFTILITTFLTILIWIKRMSRLCNTNRVPYKYITYYTCAECKQINRFGVPSEIRSKETVEEYCKFLNALVVKYEHTPATKRILHEISPYIRRIEFYLKYRNSAENLENELSGHSAT